MVRNDTSGGVCVYFDNIHTSMRSHRIPDYSQLFHPEFQHINRIIHTTADELGMAFLDMTPIYEATERAHSNYFWPLDGHTNEVGHRAIAEALTPILCDRLNKMPAACRPPSN